MFKHLTRHPSNHYIALVGIFVIILCAVIPSIDPKGRFAAALERFADDQPLINNNIPERQPVFTAARNVLLYTLFKDFVFNGSLDTSIHVNALQEYKNKTMFYTTSDSTSYDTLCEKTNAEDDKALLQSKADKCTTYDLQALAVREQQIIPGFENSNAMYPRNIDDENAKDASIIMDNNFYLLKQNMTKLSRAQLEVVIEQTTTGSKQFIAVTLSEMPLWLVMCRPLLVYVSMVGYFRVAYDVRPHNNIMNLFQTNPSQEDYAFYGAPRLYLEPVPTSFNTKPLALQSTEFRISNETLDVLKKQLDSNKVILYYISPAKSSVIPPRNFATVLSCTLHPKKANSFSLGTDGINAASATPKVTPPPIYEPRIVVQLSSSNFQIEVGDTIVFKAEPRAPSLAQLTTTQEKSAKTAASNVIFDLVTAASSYQILHFNTAFAFNTYTITIIYRNLMSQQNELFTYRGVLEGTLADKCFAFNPLLTNDEDMDVSYALPYTIGTALKFNIKP